MVQTGFGFWLRISFRPFAQVLFLSLTARVCKRDHSDRLLCPIRALKFYLKMTKPYRQNRTRPYLPIKGKQDVSKSSVSRWMSYTIKLAYRKLTRKDSPFLKIKAHEVNDISSSRAFFNKVPLSKILKQQ